MGCRTHYRGRGEGGTEYRRKRCLILLQSRSRWRKRKLQRRLCSAVFESGKESAGSDRKDRKRERQRERKERDANPYFYYYVVSVVSV